MAYAVIATVLCACGKTESTYSNAPVYLNINNNEHQDLLLNQVMTPGSGLFATITQIQKGGNRFFHLASNQNTTSDIPFNAKDSRQTFILGMNHAIIVGYGLSVDAIFYAYDRECPNCFKPEALPIRSYPLKVKENGMAECANCHRTYDLNIGGMVATGDAGKNCVRYPATAVGGVLSVR